MGHKLAYLKAIGLWLASRGNGPKKRFTFCGHHLSYFSHWYNLTWLNERRVEIPVMRQLLKAYPEGKRLEVGNVLRCYDPSLTHVVVDKYEKSSSSCTFTEDAETFVRGAPYDLIFSISTLEHVGWDERPRDAQKIERTIKHLIGLLKLGGTLIFTAPIGYSPPLDGFVQKNVNSENIHCLKRINKHNEWQECSWEEARHCTFHKPYPFANALMIVSLTS
jgi:hypothetical protein